MSEASQQEKENEILLGRHNLLIRQTIKAVHGLRRKYRERSTEYWQTEDRKAELEELKKDLIEAATVEQSDAVRSPESRRGSYVTRCGMLKVHLSSAYGEEAPPTLVMSNYKKSASTLALRPTSISGDVSNGTQIPASTSQANSEQMQQLTQEDVSQESAGVINSNAQATRVKMIDSMNIPTTQAYDLQLGIKETAQDVLGRKTPPVVFSKRLPLLPHESKDSILTTALATDSMSGSGVGLHYHHLQGPQRSAAAPRSTHTVGSALERDMAAASGAPSQSGTPSMLSKAPSLSGSSPLSTEANQRQSIATTHLTPHPPTALEGFRSRAVRVSLARKMGLLLVERPASPKKRASSSYSILGMTSDTDASNYLSNESVLPIGGPTASVTISRSSSTSLPYGSTISQSQFSLPPSPPAVLKSAEIKIPSVAAAAALAAGLKASQAKSERAVDAAAAAAAAEGRQRASASAGRTRRFASLMPDSSSSSSEMLNSLMMQSWSGANKMEPEGSFLSGPIPLSNSNALLPTTLDSSQQPRAKSMPMKSRLNPVPKGSFPEGIKQRTSLGDVSRSEGRVIRDPAVERDISLNGRATAAAWESTSDTSDKASSHAELSGNSSSNTPTQPPSQSKVMRQQAPAAAATNAGLPITSSSPIARPATAVGSNGGGSTQLIGCTKPTKSLMPDEAASKSSASRSAPDGRKSRGLLMTKVVAKASLAFQSLTASNRPAAGKT